MDSEVGKGTTVNFTWPKSSHVAPLSVVSRIEGGQLMKGEAIN